MDLVFDRGVLSRQSEGIKTDREHDIESIHTHEAGAGVTGRHGIPVANVHITGRVRQHCQGIMLWFFLIDIGVIEPISLPFFLPFCFNIRRHITFAGVSICFHKTTSFTWLM